MKIQAYELAQMQSLPLEQKILKTELRIKEWYEHFGGQVCVSFSGGMDSTVLMYIARKCYPDIKAVFSDTGLEFPEIRNFIKTFDNVDWVKPKMHFKEVIEKFGYPVVSKHVAKSISDLRSEGHNEKTKNLRLTGITSKGYVCNSQKLPQKWHFLIDAPFKISSECCRVIKKAPLKSYYKKHNYAIITGETAEESQPRRKLYLEHGCNAYDLKTPKSTPLGFWTRQDILHYIRDNNLPYASVYGDIKEDRFGNLYCTGEQRTGCMFCLFGIQNNIGQNRFTRMKVTHPAQYNYCINKLGIGKVLDYLGVIY